MNSQLAFTAEHIPMKPSLDRMILSLLAVSPAAIVQAAEYTVRLDDINLAGNAAWKAWLRNEYSGKVFAVQSEDGVRAIMSARSEFVSAGEQAETALLDNKGTDQERYERFLVSHQRMQQSFANLQQTVATHGRRVK